MSVKDIMDTWTLQTGFPVVHVTRDYENRYLRLRQDRFVLKEAINDTFETEQLWWIPITYTTRRAKDFQATQPVLWMKREKEVDIHDQDILDSDWLIVNIQETGYYRVNYDPRNWRLITTHLMDSEKYREIAATNRAQLVNDALSLAKGGYLDYSIALDVTRYLEHEDDFVPWKAAINSFGYIDTMLIKTGDYALFKVGAGSLVQILKCQSIFCGRFRLVLGYFYIFHRKYLEKLSEKLTQPTV